jgi:glutamine synthetase
VTLSEAEREANGIERLPRNLGEAIELFESSSFVRDVLGEHIADFYAQEKRKEWDEYCSTVTDWERAKYYAGV